MLGTDCPAWQVMFYAEHLQCTLPCLTVVGQLEVPTGQINFRSSLPRLANNVLEPYNIAPCVPTPEMTSYISLSQVA